MHTNTQCRFGASTTAPHYSGSERLQQRRSAILFNLHAVLYNRFAVSITYRLRLALRSCSFVGELSALPVLTDL
jgi:hypothetical protein